VKVKEQTQGNISEAHNPKKIDYFADLVSLNAPKVEHLERTSLYNETL
jgi:hypothetical protein